MQKKILIAALMATMSLASSTIYQKLDDHMCSKNTLVCVGLDPDTTKMPQEIVQLNLSPEEKTFYFLQQVIDITAPHACCFKLQKAFYDLFENGHDLLRKTVTYIHEQYPDMVVLIDCKIGDTDNTMKAYMHLMFEDIKADSVVINPYMGDDVLEPFMHDAKKSAVILIQTSNPNAKVIQELVLENGKMLWEELLELTLKRWNNNNNLIVVLSSNVGDHNYATIRKQIPQETPILLAGIGAQGGNPKIMKQLLNDNKRGVFINSSRGLLFPYQPTDVNWRSSILNAVLELKDTLNIIRTQE